MQAATTNVWQILDTGSVWMKEFAYALSKLEKVVAWSPKIENLAMFQRWHEEEEEVGDHPNLQVFRFPLQRGYAWAPLRWMAPFEAKMIELLKCQTPDPAGSPLICSTPFYAPVAELWPGPVIYYVTDMTVAYVGLDPAQVLALDRRMCKVARAVCPNSRRIAKYLTSEAECDRRKITIVPNATRESNVQLAPQYMPGAVPQDAQDLPRPIAGVLGNLGVNMDWELIVDAIRLTPGISWLFVGPSDEPIHDAKQSVAREWAKKHMRFVGMKPYVELQAYARCLDVAVLPYRKKEPTYSGSSTRFYEHLAAGRPMVATHGFAELLEKEPLLKLVETADEAAAAIAHLQSTGFQDGHEVERWEASKLGTWAVRARVMRDILKPGPMEIAQGFTAIPLAAVN